MDTLRLRFSNQPQADIALGPGIHAVGRGAGGTLRPLAETDTAAIAQFCVDRRGVWLKLDPGARGVHVNGRPVRHMAMLRMGDAVYIDGAELLLLGSGRSADAAARVAGGESGDPRVLLRGVGGHYHGRSLTLSRPRLVGRAAECDIRIDDPAFPERHARIEVVDGRVRLTVLEPAEGTLVNGEPAQDAALAGGDQLVFDAHQRFVLEAPGNPDAPLSVASLEEAPLVAPATRNTRRLPWLLLAALLLAAGLSGLLLLGSPG